MPGISTWHNTIRPSQISPMTFSQDAALGKKCAQNVPYGDGLVQDFHLFPRNIITIITQLNKKNNIYLHKIGQKFNQWYVDTSPKFCYNGFVGEYGKYNRIFKIKTQKGGGLCSILTKSDIFLSPQGYLTPTNR